MTIIDRIYRWFYERFTFKGKRERANRELENVMNRGGPLCGWGKASMKLMFAWICTNGAARIPVRQVTIGKIAKFVRRYDLRLVIEGDTVVVGWDLKTIRRRLKEHVI